MKKATIITTALCLSLMATGCFGTQNTPASESGNLPTEVTTAGETTTEAATSETALIESESSEATKASHQVNVEVITTQTYSEGAYDVNSVVPKLTVDGVEATEINASLESYIQKTYPLENKGDYYEGWSTSIKWGANENTVSIVILASDTSSDYFTCEVFNYDLDTLTAIDDSEVTKRLGMTDEEFFGKTEEIINNYCGNGRYDLDKSLAAVNYDKATPLITPDGNPGVAACIVYPVDSQFSGLESIRCFNMTTMEYGI